MSPGSPDDGRDSGAPSRSSTRDSAPRASRNGLAACADATEGAAPTQPAAAASATTSRAGRGRVTRRLLLLRVLADLGVGLPRLALGDEARVEARGHAAEPRVHVEPLDLLDALGDLEHVLGRLELARLRDLEAGELVDAAGLGEPDLLAAEGLDDRRGAGRAEAVDVRVVVDAADLARALVVAAELLDVARRRAVGRVLGARVVGLVEDVRRDHRAALEDLARDGREPRGGLRVLVGRLREVVDLVPRHDVLDEREELPERLDVRLVLLGGRQLALDLLAVLALVADRRIAAGVLEGHERGDARRAGGVEVLADAVDLVVAVTARHVPRHHDTGLLDPELREQRVGEHLRVVLGDADRDRGLGARRDRQHGENGEQGNEQTGAHDRGAGSFAGGGREDAYRTRRRMRSCVRPEATPA